MVIDDNRLEPTELFAFSVTSVDPGTEVLFPRTARIDILDNENPADAPLEPPLISAYDVVEQTVASGLNGPISFEFAPFDSSLLFIAEKGGRIRVFDTDTDSYLSDFVDLSAKVNDFQDRGLLDIAFHPDFANQPYVYAFYVVDAPVHPDDVAEHPLQGGSLPDQIGNRFSYVVRFTADPATGFTTVLPGSEVVIAGGGGQYTRDISGYGEVDSNETLSQPESGYDPVTDTYRQDYIKIDFVTHAGGSLAFGPDGALYISVGDGTSYNTVDARSISVQRIDSLSGKILRVDPLTGQGLADNPFVTEGLSLNSNQAKVYQLGLRNPFSMGFDSNGRLLITNTGWNSWEEIESGPPGANFGWPYFEGGDAGISLRTPGYEDLPTAAAFYEAVAAGTITIAPAFRGFSHVGSDPGFQVQAITGGDAVYNGTVYPSELQGSYVFTDIVQGEVYIIDVNDRRAVSFLYQTNGTPVHWSVGPDGYLYFASLYTGEIGRLLIDRKPGETLVALGDATLDAGTGDYILASSANQTGLVTTIGRIDVRKSFAVTLDLNLGTSDSGGEGVSVVLHNDPAGLSAAGGDRGAMGVAGILNGLGFEIDTNPSPLIENIAGESDVVNDHAGFFDTDSLFLSRKALLSDIEDGQWHRLSIGWDAQSQTMTAFLDGQIVGTLQGDIAEQFLGGSDFARLAFGGASGDLANQHSVRVVDVQATFEFQASSRPVAINDAVRLTPGSISTSIDVLANDFDPDADALQIVSVSAPLHGTATIDDNGTPTDYSDDTITYQPIQGYTGPDRFTYTVSDGAHSSTAEVGVLVALPTPYDFALLGAGNYDAVAGQYD